MPEIFFIGKCFVMDNSFTASTQSNIYKLLVFFKLSIVLAAESPKSKIFQIKLTTTIPQEISLNLDKMMKNHQQQKHLNLTSF